MFTIVLTIVFSIVSGKGQVYLYRTLSTVDSAASAILLIMDNGKHSPRTCISMHCAAKHSPARLHAMPQHLHDAGMLPGFADQCILGLVYLRSNLSKKLRWSSHLGKLMRIDQLQTLKCPVPVFCY